MGDEPKAFQIGLVMAGAVSAAAYSAGVIDFLLEALEEWSAAKSGDPRSVPDHKVSIRAISGSSGGAMTGAILTRALASYVKPARDVQNPPDQPAPDPASQTGPFQNPFYAAWVQSIDIHHLLACRDLTENAPLVSLLDSTVLSNIADNVLRVQEIRGSRPDYVADPMELFVATTNLRGVPYGIPFAGAIAHYRHMMTLHADYMHFVLRWPGAASAAPEPGTVPLDAGRPWPEGGWQVMANAALASGAFPLCLAPRLLNRPATDYDIRKWPVPVPAAAADPHRHCTVEQAILPTWPDGIRARPPAAGADPNYDYRYLNVDAGVMNNEPLELARKVLTGDGPESADGSQSDRAIVMVDPFPNTSDVAQNYSEDAGIVTVARAIIGAMVAQGRFKPDELVLAIDEENYSRFVVSPVYRNETTVWKHALTCGELQGFSGLLAQSFREHDFQLGRRNCQRFLQQHFVLPLENPLFDSWRGNAALCTIFSFPDPDPGFNRRLAPIIPLTGALVPEAIPLPPRPRPDDIRAHLLRTEVDARLSAVIPKFIDTIPIEALKQPLRLLWRMATCLKRDDEVFNAIINATVGALKDLNAVVANPGSVTPAPDAD